MVLSWRGPRVLPILATPWSPLDSGSGLSLHQPGWPNPGVHSMEKDRSSPTELQSGGFL